MANIKSQKKRNLTNEKARQRNKAIKSELKTAIKKVEAAVEAGEGAVAREAALAANRLLDIAASKGVIHKKQAANRKSGVAKLANSVPVKKAPAKKAAPKSDEDAKAEEKKPAAKKAPAKKPAAKKAPAKKAAAKKDDK